MCSCIFSATQRSFHALQPQRSISLLFSVFFFVSFRFVVVVVIVFFAREEKNVASLACLATQVYFPHSPLSLFFFSVRKDENMLRTSLTTQAFRHTGLITTQDYFLTGLFCHRFIRHMGPLYAFFYHTGLFHWQRSKYCTPHLPQRTIFHTGLLHALRSHMQVFTKR